MRGRLGRRRIPGLRNRGPRFVGLVTIGVVAALIAALFVPSGFALGKATYHAELVQAGGLRPGSEVRVAGVAVGEVSDMHLRDGRVRASFRISDSVRLGPDSTAAVKVATLLGNHYLELRPAGAGPLPERTIPVANTRVPFAIQEVIEAGGTALEELDGGKLRDALTVLADDFRDTPALTRQTLTAVSRLSDVIIARKDQIDRLISSAGDVTANLDENRQELIGLMRQASLILAEVTRRREVISELLTDTRALSRQLTGLVRDNEAKIAPLLENVNVVLGTLRDNEKSLKQIATLLGPASRYFANATGNGPYIDVNGPNAVFPDGLLCIPQQKCLPPRPQGGGS